MIIITVKGGGKYNAGPKAPSDIISILQKEYNAKSVLLYQQNNIFEKLLYRLKIYTTFIKSRLSNDVLVMQFPLYETTSLLNKLLLFNMNFINKKKSIVIIHDLDGIRSDSEILKKQEIDRLKKVNYIVVHNEKMKEFLINSGIPKEKMYNLELFDYLCDEEEVKRRLETPSIINVAYAGNLTKEKSPFIYELEDKLMKYNLLLYGVGITNNISDKIKYNNKYLPNELPNKIEANVGLVWDGLYDERDEKTGFKKYTKYNNPHKLSCYIAGYIPVIVWQKSAVSDFVIKNNIGYTINNLYDINKLNFKDYKNKCNNIKNLSKKVRSGYYTKKVMDKILKDMEKNK